MTLTCLDSYLLCCVINQLAHFIYFLWSRGRRKCFECKCWEFYDRCTVQWLSSSLRICFVIVYLLRFMMDNVNTGYGWPIQLPVADPEVQFRGRASAEPITGVWNRPRAEPWDRGPGHEIRSRVTGMVITMVTGDHSPRKPGKVREFQSGQGKWKQSVELKSVQSEP